MLSAKGQKEVEKLFQSLFLLKASTRNSNVPVMENGLKHHMSNTNYLAVKMWMGKESLLKVDTNCIYMYFLGKNCCQTLHNSFSQFGGPVGKNLCARARAQCN